MAEGEEVTGLIDNGPFGAMAQGEAPAAEAETPAAETPASEATTPTATIFQGIQRSFTDINELSKYTLELEKQTLEQQARLSGLNGLAQPAAPAAANPASGLDYKQLGERFILDPAGAVQDIISHVRSSVMGEVATSAATQTFYQSFYEANEDLVGCEDLVDASVARNQQAWKNVPTEQAAKLLAADVRARAAKIRGSAPSQGTVLSGKPAHALPTGGNPAPKITQPPAKALSFADQLKAQQSKHKKRA